MNTGFIGFGEAAFNIALGLLGEGVKGIRAYDAMENDPVMGKLVHKRAEEAQVEVVSSPHEIAQWANLIIAAVPSSYTVDVCKTIMGDLNEQKIYADVSASTPSAKITIWNLIKDSGVKFVDAAMLGSLPKDKHKVPITAAYFGMLLALAQRYDKKAGFGTLMSNMMPYVLGFFIFMVAELLIWFFLDLPLGPGAGVHFSI